MKKLPILAFIFIIACQSGKNRSDSIVDGQISIDSLKSEVLFLHDEVMPKMGELRRVRKDLMLQADSLMQSDSTKANIFNSLANEIGNSSEGMMQWMRAFEPDFEGTEDEVRSYLEAQKESIQIVKTDMENSLTEGRKAIGQD